MAFILLRYLQGTGPTPSFPVEPDRILPLIILNKLKIVIQNLLIKLYKLTGFDPGMCYVLYSALISDYDDISKQTRWREHSTGNKGVAVWKINRSSAPTDSTMYLLIGTVLIL